MGVYKVHLFLFSHGLTFFLKKPLYAFSAEMRRYKVSLLLKNSCVLFLGKRVTIRGHSGSPVSVGPQMRASQQILSLHVKCAGPQFRRPPKKLRLPRCCASPEFSYSLTLREERSGSPVSALICWVCTKHAVSPQVLRLPRIFLLLNITQVF